MSKHRMTIDEFHNLTARELPAHYGELAEMVEENARLRAELEQIERRGSHHNATCTMLAARLNVEEKKVKTLRATCEAARGALATEYKYLFAGQNWTLKRQNAFRDTLAQLEEALK